MSAIHRVLVVESDINLTSVIVGKIRAVGFDAETVSTIKEAETAFAEHSSSISAMLLEVHLPDGDGRDFCARIRDTEANLPIILMSTLTAEDDVVRGLELGADAYVPKPLDPSELVARLKNLLPAS